MSDKSSADAAASATAIRPRRARKLGKSLEARGYPVVYLDETLTSDDAKRWLRERGETSPESGRVDQVAALLILQEYLAGSAGETGA